MMHIYLSLDRVSDIYVKCFKIFYQYLLIKYLIYKLILFL